MYGSPVEPPKCRCEARRPGFDVGTDFDNDGVECRCTTVKAGPDGPVRYSAANQETEVQS